MTKIIKLGILGGSVNSTIGSSHIKAIRLNNHFSIDCAFFSRNKIVNELSAKKYNLKKNRLYSSVKELLACEKKLLDAIIVLTPPSSRYEIFKLLVNANIPIICEKPLSSSFSTSKKIYNLIKKNNLFFTSTYNYTGYPAIREIRELVIKKSLGEIISFNFEMPQQTFVYDKSKIAKWRKKDYSIPTLYLDLCSHIVNISNFIFNKYPNNVMSFSTKNKKYKVVDNVYSWFRYENSKMIGNIWFSKNSLGQRNSLKLRINGTKLGVQWDHFQPENLTIFYNNGKIETLDRASPNTEVLKNKDYFTYTAGHPNGFLDAFSNLYSNIYKEIIKYKSLKKINYNYLTNIKDNINIISVLDSIRISAKNNKWIKTKIIK